LGGKGARYLAEVAALTGLRIRLSDEEYETGPKSIKTRKSIRVVPLHKHVIELGFLDYVASLKGAKMFPQIKPDSRGRWSGDYSKWFGRFQRSIGLDQRWTDFHSFRGTRKTAARGAGVPEDIHDEITGHHHGSVGRGYANPKYRSAILEAGRHWRFPQTYLDEIAGWAETEQSTRSTARGA
jgi:hypothetical protein